MGRLPGNDGYTRARAKPEYAAEQFRMAAYEDPGFPHASTEPAYVQATRWMNQMADAGWRCWHINDAGSVTTVYMERWVDG